MTHVFTIFRIILYFLSCSENEQQKNEFNLGEVKKIIIEQTNAFTQAHITKDVKFIDNSFTIDARVFPPNSEPVIGIDAISKLNMDWVGYGIKEFTETSTRFYGNPSIVIDEGTYSLKYGDENTVDKGSYINIWKNIDGHWKLYSNIWNSDLLNK